LGLGCRPLGCSGVFFGLLGFGGGTFAWLVGFWIARLHRLHGANYAV
jgi:hypothetical protein